MISKCYQSMFYFDVFSSIKFERISTFAPRIILGLGVLAYFAQWGIFGLGGITTF